jgi:hypothetical protein
MSMLGCMTVLGRVATSDMSAIGAHAQVHPTVAGFYAVFADVFRGLCDSQVVEVTAFRAIHVGPSGR